MILQIVDTNGFHHIIFLSIEMQNDDLETLMFKRIEEQENERKRFEEEKKNKSENRTHKLRELIAEIYDIEYGDLDNIDQHGLELSPPNPNASEQQPTHTHSNDDVNGEKDRQPETSAIVTTDRQQTSAKKMSLFGKIITALYAFFRRIRGALSSASSYPIHDKNTDENADNVIGDRDGPFPPPSSVQPTRLRTKEDVSDEIFNEYIENHMTVSSFQVFVQSFVDSPRVQNNLDEDEIDTFFKSVMQIVLNFGCTKKSFANETKGIGADGENYGEKDMDAFDSSYAGPAKF